ncbi:MAG: lipid A biosynthesis lauroyl acyltransferase, partial [Candidatus Marinimicrobia bacterium]|nr:lipid A biosynthesis lauroyl acyltransferase [Candidatus Neomarinimicrobiota bacterium]MBT6080980.1 lipid A biosynthesis lauroyl acyltransferase [Gammaproteobacteria bacterium]
HLTIHPPLENFPSKDAVADTQQIMDLFESVVRKSPEQYLWVHRRFKRQPKGYPPFYT